MRMVIDPRCGRKAKHDHAEILTYLAAGYLAGRDSVRRCLQWCRNHIDFLRQHLEFKNGIDTATALVMAQLRIAILREKTESGPTEMRDQFNDDLTLIEKYAFRGIAHL